MKNKNILFILVLVFVIASPAFAGEYESPLEKNWGKSYQMQKNNQTVNPDACKNLEPVIGLDGQAAAAAMGSYLNSFSKKQAGDGGYTVRPIGIMSKQ